MRAWRALHGLDLDVIFRQEHEPDRLGLSDFTAMGELGVTIAGEHLDHRLYHFCLAFSGFEHAHVVLGGKSFAAAGGGSAECAVGARRGSGEPSYRSLSAAFRNLERDAQEDLNSLTERDSALSGPEIAAAALGEPDAAWTPTARPVFGCRLKSGSAAGPRVPRLFTGLALVRSDGHPACCARLAAPCLVLPPMPM